MIFFIKITIMIHLVVDSRENELQELLKHYSNDTIKVIVETLDIGDIHIKTVDLSGNPLLKVVLERKTASDMGASQTDGRYREQRARLLSLRGTGVKIGYIIEAPTWSSTLSRTWCLGKFNEVHLQTTIARLQLRYDIPVFHATSMNETVFWIRRFVQALQTDENVYNNGMAKNIEEAAQVYTQAIHVKKAANTSKETIFHSMMLTIPGIGQQVVKAIGTEVNFNISELLTKSVDELAKIQVGKRKVGNLIATRIYEIFHSA
jgi:ERCC4-type nuclease